MSTIVLITGGNRGLGRAYVEAILNGPKASTYKILITARNADAAKAAAKELGETQVAGYGCDIENEGQVDELVKAIEKEYGRVDILINNAGTFPRPNLADDRGCIRWTSAERRNDPERSMDQIILPQRHLHPFLYRGIRPPTLKITIPIHHLHQLPSGLNHIPGQ